MGPSAGCRPFSQAAAWCVSRGMAAPQAAPCILQCQLCAEITRAFPKCAAAFNK